MLKIRIRTKLAAALAVPLVALVGVSAFEAVQASEEADAVRAEAELATVAIGPSSLTTELQNERNFAAIDLIGLSAAATLEVSSIDEARERVDTAIEDLEAYLAGRGESIGSAFAPAFEVLESNLETSRELYDDYDGPKDITNQELADELFEQFTTMTTAFFDATQSIATGIDDNALRNGSELVDQGNRRGELLASITRIIVLDTLTSGDEDAFRAAAAGQIERVQGTEERIRQLSVGPYEGVDESTLDRPWDIDTAGYFADYLADEPVDLTALLEAVSAGGADGVTSAGEMATEILAAEADRLTSEADERRTLFLALAAGVVAVAVLVSWLASRSITRPLRRLRVEAHEMASNRLPRALGKILDTPLGEDVVIPDLPAIEVKTRDEVREVVQVLNDVQDRTLALAADQAVLRRNIADSFVNLGRRNQNLLDRQLEFITELEESETEPEELESLFRLDHLATRMRRNAESLLVLAGVESPRQWAAPLAAEDVVRAALGEVEDYQRVNVRHLDDVHFSGSAASALSHVLAELIENALHFSPPGETVELKGRLGSGGYLIAVDDDGIGMSEDELERANRRLSGEESYTVAPSRYLGHYVAGNLAQRLGISVRLQDRPAGGVTATVLVPTALLATPEPNAEPTAPAAVPSIGSATGPASAPADVVEPVATPPAERSDGVAPAGEMLRAAMDSGPSSLAEALGRHRLDDIETGDDLTAAIDGIRPPSSQSALPRRVPGAQRPDVEPTIARAAPEGDDDAPDGTNALGFLAGFSAATETDTTREEDR